MSSKTSMGKRIIIFCSSLVRLHHTNAFLFFILSISGILLFSSAFRSSFPSLRVPLRDVHIWIGMVSCFPLLLYFLNMRKHIRSIRKRKNNQINLTIVLSILILLIVSGVILTFQRHMSPVVASSSLFIHNLATWFGLPYVIYHSVTRSKWFKKRYKDTQQPIIKEPLEIKNNNPIYRRRTFLKLTSATILVVMFFPFVARWLNLSNPLGNVKESSMSPSFSPMPKPAPQSAPPIGGGKRGEFRYYTVTEIPKLTDENWSLTIDGLVEKQMSLNWEQFLQLKREVQVSDFHCITGWSVYSGTWEGIPLWWLLEQVGVKKDATFVKFYSADGVYTDSLALFQAKAKDIMVAVLLDGELITEQNGGPVRLIVPQMYAYKAVKWLNRIELIDYEHIGYWEERGYPKNATVGIPLNL
ncbi:molybdopterin-dependent oxidoreductase [Bacillus alkalicellulosilyticus]|uniref:molybdopterin-dependent oxidoreductase n=1 Tax=Alkalihalobacterium alkalicellulosilyticum TaxID=1912214 RepID=UPI001FEB4FB6|nr:molybdopterin-dependent oxidoreductase [Bacillus alkalicellulosilyticus]